MAELLNLLPLHVASVACSALLAVRMVARVVVEWDFLLAVVVTEDVTTVTAVMATEEPRERA